MSDELDAERIKARKARFTAYARNAELDAMLRRLRDDLAGQHDQQEAEEADVPLHRRGFGVMDEPPA